MELRGHLLYYPEGKHDINLDNYVQLEQLRETSDAINNSVTEALKSKIDSITKTTYADLKNLRDNSKLVPGSLYRITDYQCTTTQENTRSAGHWFDIVLLALSANKLAEEGWAMMHDNIYDVTFADGVTLKCYWYQEPQQVGDGESNLVVCSTMLGSRGYATNIDMEGEAELNVDTINKTATCISASTDLDGENIPYNYFQNSNLSAWKVWYCLDNDKSRFAWADDSVDEDMPASITATEHIFYRKENSDINDLYGWYSDAVGLTYYTESETPSIGDTIYDDRGEPYKEEVVESYTPAHEGTGLPNGRGVIYRLIDEWNNDVGYDFKNVQYLVGNNWVYTLSKQGSIGDSLADASVFNDGFVVNNHVSKQIDVNEGGEILAGNILIQSSGCSVIGLSSKNNMIGGSKITLINCSETRINHSDSILISCSRFTPEESGYYLVNKKVLTEE